VLEAAEAGVLLLVDKDKLMVQLQAQAEQGCKIIIELVRIFLMLVVAEAQAVVMGQVQLLVELAAAVLVQVEL
jgi:RecA/RadA recombinase